MSKPRLRRWHFDLAIVLGLLLIPTCSWLVTPRPKWQAEVSIDPTINTRIQILGFTEDNQTLYLLKNQMIIGNIIPSPIIQQWDINTGTFLKEYDLQIPDKDREILKPLKRGAVSSSFFPTYHVKHRLLHLELHINDQDIHNIDRYYDIASGTCLNGIAQFRSFVAHHFLCKNPSDQHFWGWTYRDEPDQPLEVIDLNNGNVLHRIAPDTGYYLQQVIPTADETHVILLWSKFHEYDTPIIDVFRINGLMRLHRVLLPPSLPGTAFLELQAGNWFVAYYRTAQETNYTQTNFHHNHDFSLMEKDDAPSSVQFSTDDMSWVINGNRIRRCILPSKGPLQEPFRTADAILRRIGIALWPQNAPQHFYIYDAKSGELLRQLSGLSGFDVSIPHLDNNGRYLVDLSSPKDRDKRNNLLLSVYEFPHYLWQPTIRWIMYLSWILVFPWPLRYFIKPAGRLRSHHAPHDAAMRG